MFLRMGVQEKMILQTQRSKITDAHLIRKAIIYIRQSTDKQVKQNKESLRLQYALEDRARDLGFTDIEIIDIDLGSSAAVGPGKREGFDRLIASVAVGEVGMIFCRGVSRLSRTDKDWGELLTLLPPGYLIDTSGKVMKSPDKRVGPARAGQGILAGL